MYTSKTVFFECLNQSWKVVEEMSRVYSNVFKNLICKKICEEKCSTSQIANKYDVPLKTVENWVTRYNKNSNCFLKDDDHYLQKRSKEKKRYDELDIPQLIEELKKRDTEISYLRSIISSKRDEGLRS